MLGTSHERLVASGLVAQRLHPVFAMPREVVQLATEIPYLSVLDEDGNFDEGLAPQISTEKLKYLYWQALLARAFDERRLTLQRQGSIGTFAPVKGQEAANLGPIATLRESDWFVPSFREPAAAVYRGATMSKILLYDAGYNEGASANLDERALPSCVPVASQLPHAVGIAYANQLLGRDEVVMAYFGDGATSEGDFHEAMNLAAIWKAPVVFVCQNNQFAISVPREKQTASKTLAQKAIAYGMPGVQVDGNDLFACYLAAQEATSRARAGDGPTMIECVTYRLSVHTTADDPSQYRDEEEVQHWEKKDPLLRLRRFLIEREMLTEADVENMKKQADEDIDKAWEETKESIARFDEKPEVMFEHLFEETPSNLEKQKKAYLADRRSFDGEASTQDESPPEEREPESSRRARRTEEQEGDHRHA